MGEISTAAMGQCAVTGKIVPEDELVTINGQRVCAEGKAILLQRLKAGEGAPGEMEKPPVLRRVGSIIVDIIILAIPGWIVQIMAGMGELGGRLSLPVVLVTLIMQVVTIVYFAQLHFRGGQTLGKMAGKIRVVNLDGTPISLQTAYIRALGYAGPSLLAALVTAFVVLVWNVAARPSLLAGWFMISIGFLVGTYGLANCLFALFDGTMQRAIHDRIAGTRVILN
ncbi:MAG TPA: RDD family protein [Tepidisphaeraceae bacterium]